MTRKSHVLYRFFNDLDELLYVGITGNPATRFRQHEIEKAWWSQVAHIRLEHFASREQLEDAEIRAIQSENPRYNIVRSRKPKEVVEAAIAEASAYTLAEAAELICGGCGLKDPQLWLMRRLRSGRFRGFKVGHNWFMTAADVEAAKESLYAPTPLEPEPEPEPESTSIIDGLSPRSRRRLRTAS